MNVGLVLDRAKKLAVVAAKQARLRKGLTLLLGVILFLQMYFVRELLAAEILFGIGFLVFLVLVAVFYGVGFLGEQGVSLIERGYQVSAPVARRGFSRLEELSKRPFRHPRSESAR